MKIALLSNVTVEILAGMLKKGHRVWTPPGFGAWMETALNPPQEMLEFGPELICLLIDRRYGAFDPAVQDIELARNRLAARFPKAAIVAPDLARMFADFGDEFYDEKMWKLGKMPFSLRGLRELVKFFVLKKVVVVDLDNTLWAGVVGEDGVEGITPDAILQERLKTLKRRGILLAVLSKNNPEDVTPVWNDARMALRADDFVAMAVNWNDKSANLVEMARGLNLGMDSFVFVDDNPAERAAMRALLPEVTVADFPPQLDEYFPFAAATAEDAGKTEMYKAEARRRDFAAGLSVEDYLKGLGIWSEIHPVRADEVPRVAQLSQKTNQFNVCTNRYTEAEIAAFARAADRLIVSVHSGDRFGDYGLVAFVQAVVKGEEAEIVDWVMSCRTMNRRLEFTVEDEVEKSLAARGVKTLVGRWRKTAKNAPVAELFERFGFTVTADRSDEKTYSKRLGEP